MIGLIFYAYKENGKIELNKLIKEYETLKIGIIKQTQDFVHFDNGDRWTVVPASTSSRGHACNIAYIESTIPKRVVECLIMPTLKQRPYRAYRYFDGEVDYSEIRVENEQRFKN